jgi:hypothetical protein
MQAPDSARFFFSSSVKCLRNVALGSWGAGSGGSDGVEVGLGGVPYLKDVRGSWSQFFPLGFSGVRE